MTPPGTRIFVVDDHPLVREWLINVLREEPDLLICGQAETAPEALAAMVATPPDVAVIDLSLKESSGLDLIKDLLSQRPEIRVVVLSMHEETFYAERSLRAGARAYVMKSESTAKIVEAIRRVMAGQVYADSELLARLTQRMVGHNNLAVAGQVESLSDRELEVFRRLGEGRTSREIADALHVSIKTVQAYTTRIKNKLGLATGAEVLREALRWHDRQYPSVTR